MSLPQVWNRNPQCALQSHYRRDRTSRGAFANTDFIDRADRRWQNRFKARRIYEPKKAKHQLHGDFVDVVCDAAR